MKVDIISNCETRSISRVFLTPMERQIENRVKILTKLHSDLIIQDDGVIPTLQEQEIRK